MYLQHFGFTSFPFSINADREVLFFSDQYREAVAHIYFSLHHPGGIILLTGEVGTGKTTLVRNFLSNQGDELASAFIVNPRFNAKELLQTICEEFGIKTHSNKGLKYYFDLLSAFLVKQYCAGNQAVIVIDEAQHLDFDALEQLRLLTNFETSTSKLVQVILVGQEELRTILAEPSLRQFCQRIVGHYHLRSLDVRQTSDYISHRLTTANGSPHLIAQPLHKIIYAHTNGIPRLINVLCDRALMGAYALDKKCVDRNIIQLAATEMFVAPGVQNFSGVADIPNYSEKERYVSRIAQVFDRVYAFGSWQRISLLALVIVALASGGWMPFYPHFEKNKKVPIFSSKNQQHSSIVYPDKTTGTLVEVPDGNASLTTVPPVLNIQTDPLPRLDVFIADDKEQPIPSSDVSEQAIAPTVGRFDQHNSSRNTDEIDSLHDQSHLQTLPVQTVPDVMLQTVVENDSEISTLSNNEKPIARRIDSLFGLPPVQQKYAEYSQLLALWRIATPLDRNLVPCMEIQQYGLTCAHVKANIETLETIGIPGIVGWQDNGTRREALLAGINSSTILLWYQGDYLRMTKTAFREQWGGDSHYFIQAPSDFRTAFRPNNTQQVNQEAIVWLINTLHRVDPKYALENSRNGYNDQIIRSVKRFQQQHGLEADGIVGLTTLVRINALVFSPPTLTTNFD